VRERRPCGRVLCENLFEWSSWTLSSKRFCSTNCYELDLKERAAARRESVQVERAGLQEKVCTKCARLRPIEEFYRSKGYLYSICKECHLGKMREYERGRPDRTEAKRIEGQKRRYAKITYVSPVVGPRPMTPEDMQAELARDPICRIASCANAATDVDHDHETGIFRGMLCRGCNVRLHQSAKLQWYIDAVSYLQRSA